MPGWLSQLSIQPQLRSWSHSQSMCLSPASGFVPPSLCPSPVLKLCLSLFQKQISLKKTFSFFLSFFAIAAMVPIHICSRNSFQNLLKIYDDVIELHWEIQREFTFKGAPPFNYPKCHIKTLFSSGNGLCWLTTNPYNKTILTMVLRWWHTKRILSKTEFQETFHSTHKNT